MSRIFAAAVLCAAVEAAAEWTINYIPASSEMEIKVTADDNSWTGFVFGHGGMTVGSDMLVFSANGAASSSIGDYESVGEVMPKVSATNNWTKGANWAVKGTDGRMTMTARRAVDSNDATDYVFPIDTKTEIGWAHYSKSSVMTVEHEGAGHKDVTFVAAGSSMTGTSADHESDHSDHDDAVTVTAGTMAAAAVVLMALQ